MQIDLAPDLSLLAIAAIFLATYAVTRRFLIKPINEILVWRQSEIRGAAKLYEEAMAHFNEATTEMERKLHEAKKEGMAIRERRRAEAAAFREELLQKTRGEAEKIVGAAEREIGAAVTGAREKLERDSEMLARMTAERILGRQI